MNKEDRARLRNIEVVVDKIEQLLLQMISDESVVEAATVIDKLRARVKAEGITPLCRPLSMLG